MLLETYKPGQMIFDHGEPGDRFYIVLDGQVKVEKPELITVSKQEKEAKMKKFNNCKEAIEWANNGIFYLNERIKRVQNVKNKYEKLLKTED